MAKAKSAKKKAAKSQATASKSPADIIFDPAVDREFMPTRSGWSRLAAVASTLIFIAVLLAAGFALVYSGKVYPGVSADGVYLGGLSRASALNALQSRMDDYDSRVIPITYGDTTLGINAPKLGTKYDLPKAVDLAVSYGRNGNLRHRLAEQLRALVGRATNVAVYSYDDTRLTPYLSQVSDDVSQPVNNASFNFVAGTANIAPAQVGKRLDRGLLTMAIEDRLANTSSEAIEAPIYDMPPLILTADLKQPEQQVDQYLVAPLHLQMNGQTVDVLPTDIVGWIQVTRQPAKQFEQTNNVADIYPTPSAVSVSIDDTKVAAYVKTLAAKIDQPGQDAALAIQDGKATVFKPSRNGIALNQDKALQQIKDALTKSSTGRDLVLDVTITRPTVREDDLNNLGINELLSEGFSTFPGSSSARLTNVRIGAARFNGVLVKPGDTFSFGALLGDVGPEQGYQPSLVIIGNKEEKQYGGGLCQVSSTAYRAALTAGLPIVERTNHSFAVDFYTQPYGIPGVDATIYYPQADFKFLNDTGHYILIQTIMQGTTLKFDFYGTKTKSGVIRGPNFVTGSLDATKPSHTVFYRDVLDLSGNVMKTDTVNTYYQSSTDFTIVDNQFH